MSFSGMPAGVEEIITDCLTSFDECSQNENHEVKVSDIAEAIAHSYFDEQSPEIAQFVSRVRQELSSLIHNSDYISRDVFANVVSSFITGYPRGPTNEEYFTHVPSENATEDESLLNFDNNNVTPQQTPGTIERYKEFVLSLERNLSTKISQIEWLEKEVKRLTSEKEILVKKIAELEEDVGKNACLNDDYKRLESVYRSLQSELKASERKLKEFADREEKNDARMEELKSENLDCLEKMARFKELENEVASLTIQLFVLTEEKHELTLHLDTIHNAMARKEDEEAERKQYTEELKAKIRKMVLLQEENEAAVSLEFLRILYDCDEEEPSTAESQTNPLMFEIAAANSNSARTWSSRRQVVEASTMTAPETSLTRTPNRPAENYDEKLDVIFPLPQRRVKRRYGRLTVYIVLLSLLFYVCLYVFLVKTGICQFDRWPCWITIFQKRFFYYELRHPPPV